MSATSDRLSSTERRASRVAVAAPPTGHAPREVYVDRLKVLALVGVFYIHVGEVFNPWDEWHIVNGVRSRVVGELVVILAPWIMPLFMLLAGVSAYYSLGRRRNGTYLKQRVVRVLLPLVVGTLVLVPPQVYAERVWRGQFHGSFVAFFPHFFQGIYPQGNLSWHHLWFLAHLFLYSVVALPIFRFWEGEAGRRQLRWLARVSSSPLGLLWLALPLILERHLLWGLFPERHFLASDWSNHAMLFVAYLYGYILASQPWLGEAIDRQWPRALIIAAASTLMLFDLTLRNVIPYHLPPDYSPGFLVFWSVYALGAWAWMVVALGIGRRYLHREGPALAYGRRMGYAWYLVHQPIIVGAAVFVVPWRADVWTKLVVLTAVSLAGTIASSELVVRVPFVRRALGGGAPA